ncbi:MAG: ankyrin repeat domain-containing protein [Caldilineaceae bacterium]|nr:ankyrin repeat domain-containing protein [Caldilineaceae bacterium]HRJ42089.1 ankyrin repeat domain-containing protein [Caldilineaceae bacterium]
MRHTPLTLAVEEMAAATVHLTDAELAGGGYAWGDYPGVRMALLGTAQDLDDLAGVLLAQRAGAGKPPTRAQLLLATHREAYRDLLGLLAAIDEAELSQPPAQGEWPVVEALRHIDDAERGFFLSILAGVDAQGRGEKAAMPPRAEEDVWLAEAGPRLAADTQPAARLAAYGRLHLLVAEKLAGLSDAQLEARSPFWEPEQPSVAFRIGRFTAHLREHTVQIEKTLLALGHIPNEARLHVRTLYRALGRVEGALIGTTELAAQADELAGVIHARAVAAPKAVAESAALIAAVRGGDGATVEGLLAQNPRLADAVDASQQSALMVATYSHQFAIAQMLHKAGAQLDLFSAAAIGYLPEVEQYYAWKAESIDWFAKDGFTPLQLAAYFGQTEAALWLIEKGADIHAPSKNGMQLQAIHAAVAGRSPQIVAALIAAGADLHAQQAGGFTPLMAAEQNGDEAIAELLRGA